MSVQTHNIFFFLFISVQPQDTQVWAFANLEY